MPPLPLLERSTASPRTQLVFGAGKGESPPGSCSQLLRARATSTRASPPPGSLLDTHSQAPPPGTPKLPPNLTPNLRHFQAAARGAQDLGGHHTSWALFPNTSAPCCPAAGPHAPRSQLLCLLAPLPRAGSYRDLFALCFFHVCHRLSRVGEGLQDHLVQPSLYHQYYH